MSTQTAQTEKMSFFQHLVAAIKGGERDYTVGPLSIAIFYLSVPMILEMGMESVFALVDIIVVAQVSTNAMATVGLTETVLMLVYSVAIGLSMAATAMVARRIGEKDKEAAAVAATQTIILGIVLSMVISLIGIFYAEDILRIMGGDEDLIAEGSGYTAIMFGGNITIMLIFLINAIFRGAGDASIAMRALLIANGLNIILDPLFVFGIGPFPEMGVEGAAVATNIGRGVGVLYQLSNFVRVKSIIKISFKTFRVVWDVLFNLVRVSLGGIGQFIISTSSWILVVRIVSEFGSDAVAGYQAAFRVIIFTILPAWGLSNAAATLVGQNLGAGKADRAEKSVWLCSLYNMVFLGVVSLAFIFFAREILATFINDANVIELGANALKFISYGYVFYAYGMVIVQAFNGAGDTRTPTWINFFVLWLIQIPLAYALAMPLAMDTTGVFLAIAISESLLAVVGIIIFKRGKWKTQEI